WNGMMSFGGGWFFVSASEAITVLNRDYTLPGLGSYVAEAIAARNLTALGQAMITMVVVILVIDQLFWKPLVAWSNKFKLELRASADPPESWVFDLIRHSTLPRTIRRRTRIWVARYRRVREKHRQIHAPQLPQPIRRRLPKISEELGDKLFFYSLGALSVVCLYLAFNFVHSEVGWREAGHVLWLGTLTALRVFALLAISTVIWTPIGVAIGLHPKLARFAQPVVLLLASFPANFLFPIATIFFLKFRIGLNVGSMFLMLIGAQWYILFNVIAGAMAITTDLREMAANMRLSRITLWKSLILPAIFPTWVTGAVTASGGAWNASIISEVVKWGDKTLSADGIGNYISRFTQAGDLQRIVLGVGLMCLFVVGANRLVWRLIYAIAHSRYRLA
ncbi:MAG: ABC transporter permease subunit, partial [Mycobacteriales bacterium]